MTGFATTEGADQDSGAAWRWDVKSVNGRGLDLKLRAPTGWETAEPGWRAAAGALFQRGSITMALTWSETASDGEAVLNPAALDRAAAWAAAAEQALKAAGATSRGVAPEALLQMRGVIESAARTPRAERSETLEQAVAASLEAALEGLAAARAAEGARLRETMTRLIDEIERLTAEAAAQAASRLDGVKARLADRVAALLDAGAPADEARLAQELALLASKLDVQEEIDRLRAHVAAARDLVAAETPAGRKLDFLAQEFNREANTLCAKSQDPALTETGLALKVAIDQLKEQAANVE